MLSDRIEYYIRVLNMIQGYPVQRETEQLAFINIKMSESFPEIQKLEHEECLTPKERWERDVKITAGYLYPDGSMYCRNKHDQYCLSQSPKAIANELLRLGLYWVSIPHVREAQKVIDDKRLQTDG